MKTVYQILPVSSEAKEWLEENVVFEPWQKLGGTLCIEHGCIGEVVEGMQGAGLELGADFEVL